MKSAVFIVNPVAGRRKNIQENIRVVEKKLRECFAFFHTVLTEKEGHATALAHEWSKKVDVILVGGGDGTVNEVVNGFLPEKKTLGIIPLGTTNVFAEELGVPFNIARACDVVLQGDTSLIDVGKANKRLFTMWCGVGLDAHIISKVPPALKKMIGPFAYELTAFREVLFYKPPKLSVSLDGAPSRTAYFAIITNTRLYGGKLLAPKAKIDDGLLNVILLYKSDLLYFFRNYLGVSKNKPPRFEDVGMFQARSVRIQAEHEAASAQVDGAIFDQTPLAITIHRRVLNVFVKK